MTSIQQRRLRLPACLTETSSWLNVSCGPASPVGVFLLFVSTFIGMSVSRLMTDTPRFPINVVHSTNITLMVVGLFVQLTLYLYIDVLSVVPAVTPSRQTSHSASQFLSSHLVPTGLVPFFTVASLLDIGFIVVEAECSGEWSACNNVDIRHNHVVTPIYHTIRLCYGASTMLFCCSFHRTVFRRCALVTHGLAVIGATTVCLWFHTWFNKMADNLNIAHYVAFEKETCVNSTINTTVISQHTMDCWNRSTSSYLWLKNNARYVDPCTIQFLLLVCHCIVSWFVSCQDAAVHHRHLHTELDNLATSLEPEYQNSADETKPMKCETDMCSLMSTQPDTLEGSTSMQLASYTTSSSSVPPINFNARSSWSRFFLTGAVIANVVFCLLAFLTTYNDQSTSSREKMLENAKSVYETLYLMALSVAISAGFIAGFRFRQTDHDSLRVDRQWSGLEYIVVVTSAAPFLNSIFTIIAHTRGQHSSAWPRFINVSLNCANIVEVLLQTAFVFYAKNLNFDAAPTQQQQQQQTDDIYESVEDDRPTDQLTSVDQMTTINVDKAKDCFKTIVLTVTLSNAAIWLLDSFVEIHTAKSSFQMTYYKYWLAVFNIETPLAIYYRFNCVLLLLSVYLNT